jgi:hypothetical protein
MVLRLFVVAVRKSTSKSLLVPFQSFTKSSVVVSAAADAEEPDGAKSSVVVSAAADAEEPDGANNSTYETGAGGGTGF